MRRFFLWALCAFFSIAACSHAYAQRCDWQMQAREEHRSTVRVPITDVSAILDRTSGDGVDRASLNAARSLLRHARAPLPLNNIRGHWKVRSIQVDDGFVYAYPYFRARIEAKPGCGERFAKTSGSQRRSGILYPLQGKREMAFLGAKTVNDDQVRSYNLAAASVDNSAGRLLRIGRNELLMVLDANDRGFELYHLKR